MKTMLRAALTAAVVITSASAMAKSGPTVAKADAEFTRLAQAAKDPAVAKQITMFAAHASAKQKFAVLGGKTPINFPVMSKHAQISGDGAPFCKMHYGCHIHVTCHHSWWAVDDSCDPPVIDCPDPDCV